jgi:hypothetical protein
MWGRHLPGASRLPANIASDGKEDSLYVLDRPSNEGMTTFKIYYCLDAYPAEELSMY